MDNLSDNPLLTQLLQQILAQPQLLASMQSAVLAGGAAGQQQSLAAIQSALQAIAGAGGSMLNQQPTDLNCAAHNNRSREDDLMADYDEIDNPNEEPEDDSGAFGHKSVIRTRRAAAREAQLRVKRERLEELSSASEDGTDLLQDVGSSNLMRRRNASKMLSAAMGHSDFTQMDALAVAATALSDEVCFCLLILTICLAVTALDTVCYHPYCVL
jgi:hypothetical protein